MPPRRKGRATRQSRLNLRVRTRKGSIVFLFVGVLDRLMRRWMCWQPDVDQMELIMERFQRMNPQTFNGDESSSVAQGCLIECTMMMSVYVPTEEECRALVERAKRKRFLEGLNEDLYSLVLESSPTSYADAVDKAMDIEEGFQNRRFRIQAQAAQGTRPNVLVAQPPQFSPSSQQTQQSAQQFGRHRFRPRGHQFKKKQGSSSSGLGSSSSS
ncbi:hypothetical protein F511_17994 [Dorcoceras hygrometricum]|uniref:Uncharacterized protein n=1 Tax=Dorcoceras hygrometricum TaxID=472368 RepID=A0A2Z7C0E3_9LAMI|nr:hypothetical protein F511_17994 [Dorcoceras hygrometricum]